MCGREQCVAERSPAHESSILAPTQSTAIMYSVMICIAGIFLPRFCTSLRSNDVHQEAVSARQDFGRSGPCDVRPEERVSALRKFASELCPAIDGAVADRSIVGISNVSSLLMHESASL